MPHPFFDSVTYPWHRKDARDLHEQLWQAVSNEAQISQLYQSSGPGLLPLAPGAANVVWKQALDLLTAAKRLSALCDLILASGAWAAIHPTVRAVQSAQDPIPQQVLSDDRLFLDRRPLRDKLQRFAVSSTVRVLLVRGAADSGKSWTRHLVTQLAQAMGEEAIYLSQGIISNADDTIGELFAAIGDIADIPPQMESEDAWFKKVCQKLQVLARTSGRTWWIVIDDLGADEQGPRLDSSILRFFDQFALKMENPVFARLFHLVLIDYPDLKNDAGGRGVPTRWKDFWDEDRPDPAEFQVGIISEFLQEWAAARQKQLAADDAAKLASDIIASADAASAEEAAAKPRLERIHDAVLSALPRL
jgi:hypothetical protein